MASFSSCSKGRRRHGARGARESSDDLAAQYAANPTDISGAALPAGFEKARDVALILHGSGGPDRETAAVEARFRAQDAAVGLTRAVDTFNWMPWFTSNTDRLSFV